MTMSDHDDSGSITPAGRFARMEASLNRIEEKLDQKADVTAVLAIDTRVKFIEEHGSVDAREALEIARRTEAHVADLELGRVQSPQTAEYLKVFQKHTDDIAKLQRDQLVNDTKVATAKETVGAVADARYSSMRSMLLVVSILSGVAVLFSSGLTIASLLGLI